jgi:hypothetical protein
VCADGDEGATAANVVVQLVLEVDERIVRLAGEANAAKNSADDVWADLGGGGGDTHDGLRLTGRGRSKAVDGRGGLAEEDTQRGGETFDAQEVSTVGAEVNLPVFLVALILEAALGLHGDTVQLDTELETNAVKLLRGWAESEKGKSRARRKGAGNKLISGSPMAARSWSFTTDTVGMGLAA